MNTLFNEMVLKATGATALKQTEVIQELWSGYGEIARYALSDSEQHSIVIKHICLPEHTSHPRGWNTDTSHERKVKSYKVESNWYQYWSKRCNQEAYLPQCLAVATEGNESLIVLEDLSTAGFTERRSTANLEEIKSCIAWLAHFHASYLGEAPTHLWNSGTYWHLETRPDELDALDDTPLKKAAHAIDQKLKNSPFQTFVHGDAKLANFCFSENENKVAAVDFQYVGGGCGMKDLAYFIGSCLCEDDCETMESELLDDYFFTLRLALKNKSIDLDTLEDNWRALFPFAWTDFHRFIKGWSPGHWKINSYSERMANKVIESLKI